MIAKGLGRASLEALIAFNADGIIVVDESGTCQFCNPAAEELLGRPAEALLGQQVGLALGAPDGSEIELLGTDGDMTTVELRVADIEWEGAPARLASIRDVTQRKRDAFRLADLVARHSAIAELGRRALHLDVAELFAAAARYAGELTHAEVALVLASEGGPQLAQVAGAWPHADSRLDREALDDLMPVLRGDRRTALAPWILVASIPGKHGPWGAIVVQGEKEAMFDDVDLPFLEAVASVLADAIERQRVEDVMRHRALHDPLTGLPNRVLFMDRLEHAVGAATRSLADVSVLFLDLDHFKLVNDSLGHHAGDDLLRELAQRLEKIVRPGDTVARLGGDEFAVVAIDIGAAEALELAARITDVLSEPVQLAGHDHVLTPSIGIALGQPPDATARTLLRDADAAMYRAKDLGRGRVEIFDGDMRRQAVERLEGARELRHALEVGELAVLFQPVVNMGDRSIIGAEALVRWDHPVHGRLAPDRFIELAEDTRLIVPLGRWVLAQAIQQATRWRTTHPEFWVSVNLSARELAQPELCDVVAELLHDAHCPASALAIEITEGTLLEGGARPVAVLEELRGLGIAVMLDDFGTGYSSLSYLRRLPLDVLKIDREFIADIVEDKQAQAVVAAILTLARALGLRAIAEGVETEAQAHSLLLLGCGYAQGFRYWVPGPAAELDAMLVPNPARAAVPEA